MRPDHLFVPSADGALYDTRRPNWNRNAPLRPQYARPCREICGTGGSARNAPRRRVLPACGHGCARDCKSNRRHWFAAPNRGNPHDQATRERVMSALAAAGIETERG